MDNANGFAAIRTGAVDDAGAVVERRGVDVRHLFGALGRDNERRAVVAVVEAIDRLVEMNWKTMEYAACSQPKMAPKIPSTQQLAAKTYGQMVLPVLLETYSAIKSVPAVDAPLLSAMRWRCR